MKDFVRTATLRRQEVFVPSVHPAGEAQVDFGEALVVVAGVEHKAHYLAMDLPHSDDCFVAAFPTETTEAFLCYLRRRLLPLRSPCGAGVMPAVTHVNPRCRYFHCTFVSSAWMNST